MSRLSDFSAILFSCYEIAVKPRLFPTGAKKLRSHIDDWVLFCHAAHQRDHANRHDSVTVIFVTKRKKKSTFLCELSVLRPLCQCVPYVTDIIPINLLLSAVKDLRRPSQYMCVLYFSQSCQAYKGLLRSHS